MAKAKRKAKQPRTVREEKTRVNKSKAILEYMKEHPDAGPTAVARALAHLDISPAYVSVVKNNARLANTRTSGPKSPSDVQETLLLAAKLIRKSGGIEAARRALDAAVVIMESK